MSLNLGLRRSLRVAASSVLILALTGCGGGGSGGQPQPAPAPPIPAPPPPPPPPPPVRFTLSAVAPAIGQVYFDANANEINEPLEGPVFTNRIGEFTAGIPDRILPGTIPSATNTRIFGSGIDTTSGILFGLSAPSGATVVSPITTLVEKAGGDTARVREALQLNARTPLRAGTNLLTFDAAQKLGSPDPLVAQEAARVTSINLELFGLGAFLGSVNRTSGFNAFALFGASMTPLGALIRDNGRGNLEDPQHVFEVISRTSYGDPQFRQDVREAAAELLADYARAIPDLVDDPETIARFQRGLAFFILPELDQLFFVENSAAGAQRIRAMTPVSLTQAFELFGNAPRPPASGLYFPVPDFRSVPAGGVHDLFGCANRFPNEQSVTCNDILFREGGGFQEATIVSVSVDAANQARIAVNLNVNGELRVTPAAGFTGYAFFDYAGRAMNGDQAVGRVYVRVTA